MTRKRKRVSHRAPARSAAVPARRRRMAPLAGGVALVILIGGAWILASRWPLPGRSRAIDPMEAMAPEDAQRAGLALARAGHHLASLPYFRRAADAVTHSWADRFNYASALGNAAQEGRVHLGKEEPAIRSSVERVAMARRSLDEIASAEALTSRDADHATAAFERARALFTWGFPADALQEFSRARALDPRRTDIATTAEAIERVVATGGGQP